MDREQSASHADLVTWNGLSRNGEFLDSSHDCVQNSVYTINLAIGPNRFDSAAAQLPAAVKCPNLHQTIRCMASGHQRESARHWRSI